MIRILRVVVGSLLASYLLLGPALPQAFHVGKRVFPSWRMFTTYGTKICAVEMTDGETGAAIDRLSALGYDGWWAAPTTTRTLTDMNAVSRQAKEICKKQKLTDVRVNASCGIDRGWVKVATGKENACKVSGEVLSEGRAIAQPYKKTSPKKTPKKTP